MVGEGWRWDGGVEVGAVFGVPRVGRMERRESGAREMEIEWELIVSAISRAFKNLSYEEIDVSGIS